MSDETYNTILKIISYSFISGFIAGIVAMYVIS